MVGVGGGAGAAAAGAAVGAGFAAVFYGGGKMSSRLAVSLFDEEV